MKVWAQVALRKIKSPEPGALQWRRHYCST
jgi:hypothetical protein